MRGEDRTIYDFKRQCIEHSLYGVDIDSGAVEIAKLRLWLSLVVDEDDIKNIKPLPNLDYKIVCGNSLLWLPDGILINEEISKKLEENKNLYFKSTNPSEKNRIRDIINDLFLKLIDSMKEFDPSIQGISFDFHTHFSEVFHHKKGFDVVIANPPYIQIQSFSGSPEQKAWEQQNYTTYVKTGDVYCLFYEKGFNLLSSKGILTFITSNKWMRASYGKPMRKFFLTHGQIAQLIDFGDSPIFENATTYTNILVLHKNSNVQQMKVWDLSKVYESDTSLEAMLFNEGACEPLFAEDSFVLAKTCQTQIKKRIEEIGVPLKKWDINIFRGILTGMNEAFFISSAKKDELIAKDPKSAEIIKPILRGRDIKRYKADFAELWLIFIPWHFPLNNDDSIQGVSEKAEKTFQKEYPVLYQHLLLYKNELSLRNQSETGIRYEWYALQRCAATYYEEFKKDKIVYAEIVNDSAFFFDTDAYYPEATAFLMTGERLKYLTALLNSKLLTYAFKTFYAGGDLRGNTFRYKKVFLENLPVPRLSLLEQRPFEVLVDQILATKKKDPNADTTALERQIDKMVYKIYELTPEEIAIVEGAQ